MFDDIEPVFRRAALLRWTHDATAWPNIAALLDGGTDFSDPTGAQQARRDIVTLVRDGIAALADCALTAAQDIMLDRYIAGQFVRGPDAARAEDAGRALDRAVLARQIGGGFFPGIEIGFTTTRPDLWSALGRLTRGEFTDHDGQRRRLMPGMLTQRMACPWQADFCECRERWWPAQRPDKVRFTEDGQAADLDWERGVVTSDGESHQEHVRHDRSFRPARRDRAAPSRWPGNFCGDRARRILMARPDAVVIGGGPAGAAAALALAARGARIVLFERNADARPKVGEIIDSSVQLPLRELALWEPFLARRHLRQSASLACWGGADPVFASQLCCGYGEGFLVHRCAFEAMLREALADAGVDIRLGCGRVRIQSVGHEASLSWPEGALVAPVVIDATGRAAGLGTGRRKRIDRLIGLLHYRDRAASLAGDPHLLIEATRDGWWYSAPLPGGRAVFAFMSDADLVPRAAAGRGQWLGRQLAAAPLTMERSRAARFAAAIVRPATSERRSDTGPGWYVAIGDAAASYDPVTGLGVAAAMAKGAALGRLLGSRQSPPVAIAKYREAEASTWAAYLASRRRLYRREGRWPADPFWARRRA